MVGSCTVVPQRLRCVSPEKYGPSVAKFRQQRIRVLYGQLEVLRCNPVRNIAGFVEVPRLYEGPVRRQRGRDDGTPGHLGKQGFDAGRNRI